ncbi:MAG: TolC family protein [bacterium]
MKYKNMMLLLAMTLIAFMPIALYGQNTGKSIEECVAIALDNNPELKSEEMKIKEIESKYHQQIGNLLPQLDASLSYTRYEKELPGKKPLIGESNDDYYADVSLRQVLFSGGKYVSRIDGTRILLEAEKNKYEQLKRQVVSSVKRAYYDLLKCIHTLRIQNELLEKLSEQQKIAQLLYNSGKISNIDVLKIETQRALSEDMANNLRNLVYTKSLLLAQTMGLKEPINILEDIPQIKENIKINTLCLDNNFKDNPELSYIKNLQEKTKQDIKEAKSDLFPTVFLRANYNIEDARWFSEGPDWSNWYIGVGISFPLFHGGSIVAQIDQAKSRYRQINETVRQIEININTRFESARATLIDRAARLKTMQKVLNLAKETLTAGELKYSSGKLSAMELIDMQMVWNNAEINYLNNTIDYLMAIAEIEAICPDAVIEGGK